MTIAERTPSPSATAAFETRDPRTGKVLAKVPEHGPDEVRAAVERARAAFGPWSARSFEERLEHVLTVRDLLLERLDELVDVVCRETGKLEVEAVASEVLATCELIEHYRRHGARALRPEKVSTGALLPHKRAWRLYEPMGVVGVISPWNYPFTLSMTPTVSALLAGNTVVLKPSELTPLVGLEIGRLFAEAAARAAGTRDADRDTRAAGEAPSDEEHQSDAAAVASRPQTGQATTADRDAADQRQRWDRGAASQPGTAGDADKGVFDGPRPQGDGGGGIGGEAGGELEHIVQVVTGGGTTGDALVRARVQKVAFTGSIATGRRVMQAAAETLTPVLLELGGKDPMVVCDDADLERAASGAVWGALTNAGQTCISVERVYVHEAVYDRFVELVVERAGNVRQGVGAGHDIGSMTSEAQVETVERHVSDARAKGARLLAGGRRVPDRGGLWYEPTVLVDVDHSMEVMRDETFGPVLPIMKVADDDEALRLANDSRYGLSSSVWSADEGRARRIADALEVGNVCINDCLVNYAVGSLPFGGVKQSGIGRVHGDEGLRAFCHVKSVLDSRLTPRRELQWYPTPRWARALLTRLVHLRYRRGLAAKLRRR